MSWEHAAKRITLASGAVISAGGAVGVVYGLLHWLGPGVAVGFLASVGGIFGVLGLQRAMRLLEHLRDRFEDVEAGQAEIRSVLKYHFEPNGHEDRWPELRDRPMRELVGEVHTRLNSGSLWMRDHEALHEEQLYRRGR